MHGFRKSGESRCGSTVILITGRLIRLGCFPSEILEVADLRCAIASCTGTQRRSWALACDEKKLIASCNSVYIIIIITDHSEYELHIGPAQDVP